MKEINIAKVVSAKRKERGITQDELADYMGVSKASVSKWETGLSYPDITLLPGLANYFNISIDELLEYTPQMSKKDIKTFYHKLAARFAEEPFDRVMVQCREIIKKYYSCFPLLFEMAVLLMNHCMLAGDPKKAKEILREAADLCQRVKSESGDVQLSKDALHLQAVCLLSLGEPLEVLDLLGEEIGVLKSEESLIARACHLMGKTEKAVEVTQVNIYQHLMVVFDSLLYALILADRDMGRVEEILRRALLVADAFEMEHLQPNTMVLFYAMGARAYCLSGQTDKALDLLERYVNLCIGGFFPYKLHGDAFFDSIDGWLKDLNLGEQAPRSEKIIKESMLNDVLLNPDYAVLSENPRFQNLVIKLKKFAGGN